MATRRERNNLASKKSYERAVERTHATDYEFAMIERHRAQTGDEAWHWSVVPEDHLFEAGYIHDFAKHRLMRLMNKKRMEEGENRLRDYGLDGLARGVTGTGEVVYHGLQAKYYTSRSVTAEDIGSFFAKQISMTLANPLSRGYLYTTTRLQADLADEVAQPTYPIRHVLYPWKHPDRRLEPGVPYQEGVLECDLPLRDYQVEVLAGLVDGRNAVCIPCRMGKTLIAGHWTKRLKPRVVIAIAPLKVSVENLRERLACFLHGYAPLLVDSDAGGTTDEKEIEVFLERTEKGESVVIYSTFQSAEDVLARWEWEEDTVLLVDEAHNAMGRDVLCEWIQGFRRCLAMSATFPEEVCEAMEIEHKAVVPFSKGIEGGYIVDYTLWLPSLTKHEDGSTSVEAEIPVGFEAYERSMVLKALYHAACMLRTGSRRTIVYLGSQADCDEYMAICRRVLEEYHGVTEVWMGKITSDVTNSKERKAILKEFQEGEAGSFRIMTSVRILDEAVDIPSCDSVFITTVGEQSSDIRFFQRAQRSGTLDPKNPMKRNNIFLWAEGWERCVGALSLLREADPKFHAKVRHAGVGYERGETRGGRAERVVRERVEFTEWSRMACETVEERVRRKGMMLLEFVEQEQRIPPSGLEWKEVKLGQFWTSVKGGANQELYRTLLSRNPILRADYERTEQEREEKKEKGLKTPEEKARLLLEWVEQERRVSPSSLEWKGVKLGQFWSDVKGGNKRELYQTLLSQNSILRADYERTEQEREEKRKKGMKTPEEKARLLLEWVEQERRVSPSSLEWKGVKLGQFWISMKGGRNQELYQTLLSSNLLLRADYERVEQEREEKKEKGLKTPEEKARILLEWVEQEKQVPPKNLEWGGIKIGGFWNDVKGGKVHQELYRGILSTCHILQTDYERRELIRGGKESTEQKTPEDKGSILMEWIETERRVPPYNLEWKGIKLGQFWSKVKNGRHQEFYRILLSTNPILRVDYERTEQEREQKKENGLKIPEEKANMLIEWVEQKGRIPPSSLEWKGVKLGQFWSNVKGGTINQELYQSSLSTCHILREDYERTEHEREEKKEKGLKTPEEKAKMLMECVEQEGRIPPYSLEWKGVKLGHFWIKVKSGRNQELYRILLSTNHILRVDYERTEQEREEKKEKGLNTPEEKTRMLLDWVEWKKRVPPQILEWKGVKLGHFWNRMKNGQCQELYQTLLSTNLILKSDYERTEQEREEKKEKGLKTPEEKARLLMEWVEQEGRTPPQSLEWKGVRLGSFWNSVKSGANQELYRTLLSTNPLLQADYDRLQLLKQNKNS